MEVKAQDQIAFYLTGQHNGSGLVPLDRSYRPALFARYEDLTALRYDFPLVLNLEGPPERAILSLSGLVDDAVEVLRDMLGAATLDGVHIFFPDPWHKARHNKRRLIQAPFIAQLARKLKPGGYIHVATDWQDYAEQVLAVLAAEPLLENTEENYAPRPAYRPLTKFEQRGIRLGHGVWDLVFRRKA